MKVALIRGDFANPWEIQNFEPLKGHHNVTLFTGYFPVSNLSKIKINQQKLFSPVDLNFGHVDKWKMAILNRIFTDAHVLFDLEKKIDGYDIVHSAETYYSFTRQAIVAKIHGKVKRVVSTVWENIPFNNESIHGRKELKKFARLNTDKFLAVTLGARKALLSEGVDENKIIVLRPGVNLNNFKPFESNRFRNLTKRNGSKNETFVLFVGRLEEEKGVLRLVKEFGPKIKGTSINLLITGSGSLKVKVENFIATTNNNNVHVLGDVSYNDMPKLYNFSDFLIHPAFGSESWVEQYGMVLIEAMACGKSIIGAKSGAIPEIVGDAGIIADKKSIFEVAFKVAKNKKLILDLNSKSRLRAEKEFDSEKYAKRLNEIYTDLIQVHK